MRRVAFAILSTVAGLVGLLTFKTESLGSTVSSAAVSTTHASSTTTPNSGTTSSTPTKKASTPSAAKKSPTKSTSTKKSSTTAKSTVSSGAAAAPKTVTGSVINTEYGPVQVQITVAAGKVTAATAVQYPNGDPRSQQINAYAVPILQKETVGISSASSVDMVSGATYTSNGYLQSLQSALDQAGL